MALASSLSAAPPPLTWATSSPSSPAQLPSASAAPSSPASTALLPLAPERHQLVHRRTQIWLHPRSQCLSTAPLPVLVSAATSRSALAAQLASALASADRHPSHQHRLRPCQPDSIGCALVVGCTVGICLGVGCTVTLGIAASTMPLSARRPHHRLRSRRPRHVRRVRQLMLCAFGIGVGCAVGFRLGVMASVAQLPLASASTTPSESAAPSSAFASAAHSSPSTLSATLASV